LISFTLLGLAIAGIAVRLNKGSQARKAKIEAAVGRTQWPRRVGPWLLSEERVVWEQREHPIAILRWWALCLGGPLGALILGPLTGSWSVFLALLLVPPLIASWKILEWWLEWRAITDNRVMEVKGILTIKAPAAQLGQILTVQMIKPLSGRVLDWVGLPSFAHFVFETAAQVEAVPGFRFVTDPEEAYELLQSRFKER